MNGQLHAPAALLSGKKPPVPIGYGVGWILEPVSTKWRREKFRPYRDSNPDSRKKIRIGLEKFK
jgi:hypothetical protein